MNYLFIDFDSTFIRVEGLDELARISGGEEKFARFHASSSAGMAGKIEFAASLQARMADLGRVHRDEVAEVGLALRNQVSVSVLRHREFFRRYGSQVFVVSGGFVELIWPVVADFGLSRAQVLANRFLYDYEGYIVGVDPALPLCRDGGKAEAIAGLGLVGLNTVGGRGTGRGTGTGNAKGGATGVVLGDGMTDLQAARSLGLDFVLFSENHRRSEVVASLRGEAEHEREVGSFDEFLRLYANEWPQLPGSGIPRKALLLERVHPKGVAQLRAGGFQVEELAESLGEAEISEKLKGVEVLGVRSKTELTRKVVAAATDLKAIGCFCIGTEKVDLDACQELGIAVFNAPYSNTRSVVELAIGEIIFLFRRVLKKNADMHRGWWDKSTAGSVEVRGKKLGILGYGNIGSQLSVIAEALGMEVFFFDSEDKLPLGNARRMQDLPELLRHVDILSVHVSWRESNHNLIGSRELGLMRKGSMLVNLSRGKVVDLKALRLALESGHLAGAAVDVFPKEPHASEGEFSNELQGLEGVILTPHVGGNTVEAQASIGDYVGKSLLAFLQHGSTGSSVNFPALSLGASSYAHRLVHLHRNVPGVLARVGVILAKHEINVEAQHLKTDARVGYLVMDTRSELRDRAALEQELRAEVPGTIFCRILF